MYFSMLWTEQLVKTMHNTVRFPLSVTVLGRLIPVWISYKAWFKINLEQKIQYQFSQQLKTALNLSCSLFIPSVIRFILLAGAAVM